MSTGKHQVDRKKATTLAKRDRAEYFREYRKRKFLDNDMVEVTVYIDRELRDRLKEILRDANMTYQEWFENAIKAEVLGGVCK